MLLPVTIAFENWKVTCSLWPVLPWHQTTTSSTLAPRTAVLSNVRLSLAITPWINKWLLKTLKNMTMCLQLFLINADCNIWLWSWWFFNWVCSIWCVGVQGWIAEVCLTWNASPWLPYRVCNPVQGSVLCLAAAPVHDNNHYHWAVHFVIYLYKFGGTVNLPIYVASAATSVIIFFPWDLACSWAFNFQLDLEVLSSRLLACCILSPSM